MKILLIENDSKLRAKLNRLLSKKRNEVICAENAEAGVDEAQSGIYDAVVLDWSMPEISGLEILRQIRRAKLSVPVLMLSQKFSVSDKVKGLDCGADDVLEVPYADDELVARINAITRRKGELIFDNVLQFADLHLNLGTYELTEKGKSVGLSNKEMEIMRHFFLHGQNIIGKDELISRLWGFETSAENNLEVYISYLRRKLNSINSGTQILCVKNVGYRLIAD